MLQNSQGKFHTTFPVLNAFCHLETKANPAWALGALQAQEEYVEHLQAVLCVQSWPAVVILVQQLGSVTVGAQGEVLK